MYSFYLSNPPSRTTYPFGTRWYEDRTSPFLASSVMAREYSTYKDLMQESPPYAQTSSTRYTCPSFPFASYTSHSSPSPLSFSTDSAEKDGLVFPPSTAGLSSLDTEETSSSFPRSTSHGGKEQDPFPLADSSTPDSNLRADIENSSSPETLSLLSSHKEYFRLDPIMDPAYNFREIYKQSCLLETHLFQQEARCEDCICKHFLTMEALIEEAISLDIEGIYLSRLQQMKTHIRELQKKWRHHGDSSCHDIAQQLRQLRKSCPLETIFLVDSIQSATSETSQCGSRKCKITIPRHRTSVLPSEKPNPSPTAAPS